MKPVLRFFALLSLAATMLVGGLTPHRASAASTGALFGEWAGENNVVGGTPALGDNPTNYYSPMLRWQGKNNAIFNVYSGNAGQAALWSSWLPEIWDTYHEVPLITYNTNQFTTAQVLAGSADSTIESFATSLAAWLNGPGAPAGGRRAYIRPYWEANGSWYAYSPSVEAGTSGDCNTLATDEANYVLMWQHVRNLIMSTGGFNSTQIQWVYSVIAGEYFPTGSQVTNCANGASDMIARDYPGDSYVDWTGIDGYAAPSSTAPTLQTWPSIFDSTISELQTLTTKPMSINEYSVGTRQGAVQYVSVATKAKWLSDYVTYIKTTPVKMSLFFNQDYTQRDYAAFSDPLNGDAYSAGDATYVDHGNTYNVYTEYKTGITDPYFIGADSTNSRVLSDAQFQGTF